MLGKRTNKILQISILALSTIVLLASCMPGGESPSEEAEGTISVLEEQTLAVETVLIEEGRLRRSVSSSGTIQGIQEAIIRPLITGIIQDVDFELGQEVDDQTPLLTLDDRIVRLTFQQLAGEYNTALADLESQRSLYDRGSIALNQLNQAQARVDGLAAQLQQARDSLSNTQIISPISGSIAEKAPNLIPGDAVNSGQQLARVVDLSQLKIQLSFGQEQIFLIDEGQRAEVRISSPQGDIVSDGLVTAVAAGSELATGSWRVIVEFENPAPEVLKAGMSASVNIISNLEQLRPLIPVSSILTGDGSTSIFLLDEDRAQRVSVNILDKFGEFAAIESVEPNLVLQGREVLTSGLTRVKDGDRIATASYNTVSN
jgi:membrane fusion protein (multidrug efflux system)